MRAILVVAIAITVGCSADEPTGPGQSSTRLSVGSIIIEGPDAIRVPESVRLDVHLRDVRENPVSNRLVTFASSNPEVATVDGSGVIKAVAEGSVTITVSSESVTAQKSLRILPRLGCLPERQECLTDAERYVLVLVNDRPLPVASPWGVGAWDYDADAGTWQVTLAELILFADGWFSYTVTHRAASGSTIDDSFLGRYERRSGSVLFNTESGTPWSATVTPTGLLERWPDGTTLVFEARP